MKYDRNFQRSLGSAMKSWDSIGTTKAGFVTEYEFPSAIRIRNGLKGSLLSNS